MTDPGNGCTSTAQVSVEQNVTVPGATASVSESLTCSVTSVTLQGSSATAGVSYSWIGPGDFTSTDQNPLVSVGGEYTLTVTDPGNGCTSTAQVSVEQNVTVPGATASVNESLTCTVTSVTLAGSSATAGVSYSWSGPEDFTSTDQNPLVSVAGEYTLTVTNPENGCTSTAQVSVEQNVTVPGATAGVSESLTCLVTSVTLAGSSATAGVSYSWSGPEDFTSTDQNPLVSGAGEYTLTVTDPLNGCTSTAQVSVEQSITVPGATASVSESLTCTVTSVSLQGGSTTAGVSYSWSGPEDFVSTDQNPLVSVPGEYTLTVTDPGNGCTSTAQVSVEQNITVPGAMASVNESLTCTVTSVTLQGSSATAGVSYAWTGPEDFTSTDQNPSVSDPGEYTLTVTDPGNGCTSTAQVSVAQIVNAPGATATVSEELTCIVTSIPLQGGSTTAGVSYSWIGPEDFTSTDQNPSVSDPGEYTLTVTDPESGCTSTAQVSVEQNITVPGATASVSESLTCSVNSVTLQGSSPTLGVSYLWGGPEGFTSTDQNPPVSDPGEYTLTVTDPVNGCTSKDSVEVIENVVIPDLTAEGGQHTCITNTEGGLVLQANSSATNAQYSWTVPPGTEPFFTDTNVQDLTVLFSFIIGDFTVKVTDPATGCTNSKTVSVTNNAILPVCDIELEPGNILSALAIEGGSYEWTVDHPDWQISGGQGTPSITFVPGPVGSIALFSITITDNTNGCTESCSIELENTGSGVSGTTSSGRFISQNQSFDSNLPGIGLFDKSQSASLGIYPNPFQQTATVTFSVPETVDARVEVYSTGGVVVLPLFSGKAAANREYKLDLNALNLTTGLYLCRLIYGNNIIDRKIMIR